MSHVPPHRWADAWRGKLSEGEVAAMDHHAATCARCAKARDRITRASSQAFPAIKTAPPPEVAWDSVRARVHWAVSSEKRARSRTRGRPRAYLVAGMQEPFFLENATRWADALNDAGADVVMTERVGLHGDAFWREEFPLMVAWAFGR